MKYYIYVSDSKVEMLYAQTAAQQREASLGFDVKVLKGHIKESRGIPENSFSKLDDVVAALKKSDLVGTVEEPKQYISGCLSMKWCTYGYGTDGKESPITFWGHSDKLEYPFGNVIALAGSKYHLLGEQRGGHAHSHSGTDAITRWFLTNLDDPFEEADKLIEETERYVEGGPISDSDVAHGVWLAATQAHGHTADYEFVAKVLHNSEHYIGSRVILASPLYVALAE